jgi:hypothetical protein
MEPFKTHTGIGVPLRRSNVDTDQIIPAVYLKRVTRTGFEDALFAVDAVGQVFPTPVRSSFGWHALAWTGTVAAESISLLEAKPQLRAELEQEERARHFRALMERLEATIEVTLYSEAMERALDLELATAGDS